MPRPLPFALALSFLPLPAIGAQEPYVPKAGDRIRVTAPECELHQQTAEFLTLERGFLTATVVEEEVRCPVDAVNRLEISLGTRHWWHTSMTGLVYGALVGAVTFPFIFRCGRNVEDCPPEYYQGMAGAVLGGSSGLIIGSLVGAYRGSEAWKTVPLSGVQSHLLLSPRGPIRVVFRFPLWR